MIKPPQDDSVATTGQGEELTLKRDLRLKFMTIVFALIALVSMSACAVASFPSSIPESGNDNPDPAPTTSPSDSEPADPVEIEIIEDDDGASDPLSSAAQTDEDLTNSDPGDADSRDQHVFSDDSSTDPENDLQHDEADVVPAHPVRLQIDTIDVDAAFEYVGVNDEGNMDVPQEWENVAWYEPGTIPGDIGNAVVAGHYDSDTGPAIFYELNKLAPGDHIHIVTEEDATLVFEVTEVETVHVDDADTGKIFGKTDERNLNLITCEGLWDRSAGMYDERLIVYTTLIDA